MSALRDGVAMLPPVSAEDRVRADLYAMVARLFASAPDAAFLRLLGSAPELPEEPGAALPASYNTLVRASRAMDADAATQEYTDLFVGVGKSEVNLHGSHWISGFMMDKPLAELRDALAEMGIERREGAELLEDHLAAVAEVMRLLIVGGEGRPPAPIEVQRRFFETRIAPWAFRCCSAISVSPLANYYRCASQFVQAFLAIERDALAMD
ncbi:MAG TPA: molecular chaperone TorD family protein [Casimicrobiaceae bacterium]|nr:molecular chaperone TorD family protein [Casimicrobiaceae bacterium]